MPIAVLMPALSPTMKEGNLVKWYKKEGDVVEAGDQLADIETDKATMEVEAVDEGRVAAILIPENTNDVAVNTPIAVLAEEGDSDPDIDAFIAAQGSNAGATNGSPDAAPKKATPAIAKHVETVQKGAEGPETAKTANNNAVQQSDALQITSAANIRSDRGATGLRPSPLARRLAAEHNLDPSALQGTGPRGRVVQRDIEKALKEGIPSGAGGAYASSTATGGGEAVAFSGHEPAFTMQPLSGMRRVIAQRLSESKRTAPHFYVSVSVNMEAVFALRKKLADKTLKVSVNDFVLWATAHALKAHPVCNSAWAGSNEGVRLYNRVDLAVAVALPGGLVTPVIRDAANKGIAVLSKEIKELAGAAKENRLKPDQFQGGTFTVSNMGMFGVQGFAAIVNPPQAGILAVGAAAQVPVVEEGHIVARHMMNITLSVDHRVVDGSDAAAFIGSIKAFLEDPARVALGI